MPAKLLAFLLGSTLAVLPAPATAQTPAARPDFATAYLAHKQAEFQEVEGNLNSAGRLQARDGLLAVIRAQNPLRKDRIRGEGPQRDQVEEALLKTLANYLASVGFLPNDLQALRQAGVNVIEAGNNVLFGRPSSRDEAAIAESVVLARVGARKNDTSPNDGLGSTLSVTIEKSYKGPYQAGQTVQVRQLTGATLTAEGEIGDESGQRYLLFLSPTYYESRTGTRRQGSPNEARGYALTQLASYEVQDGVLKATIFGQTGHGKPLATFESEIAPVLPRK
jgi:hypothetical protein